MAVLNLIVTVVNPREDVGCICDGLKVHGERESPQQESRKDAASRERSHVTVPTGLQSKDSQMGLRLPSRDGERSPLSYDSESRAKSFE
jgi:hypothetical protein